MNSYAPSPSPPPTTHSRPATSSTATIQQSRPMLMDTDENPDFRTWNRIYVPYTSGDVWSGNKVH